MDVGGEVDQPPPRKKGIIFKKRKTDDTATGGEQGKEAVIQLEDLSSFSAKQDKLHAFENDGDGSSVWNRGFPFNVVAEEVVQSFSDIARVEEAGDVGVDQFLQVLGFRLACIGRSQEKKHKKIATEVDQCAVLKEQLISKETVLTELKKNVSDLEGELKVEKENCEKVSKLLKKKETELEDKNKRVIDLTTQMKEFEASREGDILDAFAEGFERAVTQVKFLFPDGGFSLLDPSKVVRDGQLVDDEEVIEEGGDNLVN
ncbi:uncharacterized protein [Arachis hypogaea]|uniref:uncharacterized protein n=1 Tax=Arachis hypogaea TaxID=3818 RepID=UPI003B21C5CD